MDHLFFNGWQPLYRIIIVGVCAYASLILLLRVAGKRTISRMNAYDMIVTMALGSILAKALLSKEVSISESITATFLLIALQYGISVAMYHFSWVRHFISSKPAVLFHQGQYVERAMKAERVDKDEILAAVYAKGISDIAMVEAVILATNGHLSVLLKRDYITVDSVSAASGNSGEF